MSDTTQDGRPPLTDDDRLATALERGRSALASGAAEEAVDAFEDALSLARRLADDASEAESNGLLAQAYLRVKEPEEAARCAQMALEIARVRRDEVAVKHFEQLLITAKSSPEELEMSTAFGDGRAALLDGDQERAIERLERALALAEEVGHPVAESASTQLLAQAYLGLDRIDDAKSMARRAEELAESMGDIDAVLNAKELLARADMDEEPLISGLASELKWGQEALAKGDLERGLRHLERARDQAIEQEELVPEGSSNGLLAQVYFELGRQEDAIASARRALAIATELGHDEAVKDFESLLKVVEADPEAQELARTLQIGAMALEVGELDKASEHLEQARLLAQQQDSNVTMALACALLAKVRHQQSRRDEALELLQEGIAVAGDDADGPLRKLLAEIEGEEGSS